MICPIEKIWTLFYNFLTKDINLLFTYRATPQSLQLTIGKIYPCPKAHPIKESCYVALIT